MKAQGYKGITRGGGRRLAREGGKDEIKQNEAKTHTANTMSQGDRGEGARTLTQRGQCTAEITKADLSAFMNQQRLIHSKK